MSDEVTPQQEANQKDQKHFGSWSYHEDDCWCMMGGDAYCNRGGYVWSCCGATVELSSCAGKGNQHHTACSSRGAGKCACYDCSDKRSNVGSG